MMKLSEHMTLCHSRDCPERGQCLSCYLDPDKKQTKTPRAAALIKKGKDNKGNQRFYCRRYSTGFIQIKGTWLYRKRTSEAEILLTLASIAEGSPLKGKIRGHKKETVQRWINEACRFKDTVNGKLRQIHKITPEQLERLWAHVKK